MFSDLNIGNFGGGHVRTKWLPVERRPTPPADPVKEKPAKKNSERQEFEAILAAIMGVVRKFPDALREVMTALDRLEGLCPT